MRHGRPGLASHAGECKRNGSEQRGSPARTPMTPPTLIREIASDRRPYRASGGTAGKLARRRPPSHIPDMRAWDGLLVPVRSTDDA